MRLNYRLGVLLATLALLAVCVSALPNQQPQKVSRDENTNAVSTTIGGLLDFGNYQKLFKKSYSGLLEEAVRLKYFTANALRISIVAVKYRFRLVSYYLSLNHMSDWTREEFEKLKNKAFEEWAKRVGGNRDQQPPTTSPKSSPLSDTSEGVAENQGESVSEQLSEWPGTATNGQNEPLPPRELPIEKLIHAGEAEKAADGWEEQSLNPQLVPTEQSTKGFKESQLPVAWHSYESHDKELFDLGTLAQAIDLRTVNRNLFELAPEEQQGDNGRDDKVFVDLRETGCMAPVLDQGECGSCYAFTTMSIMEFHYCKNTGHKVRFSPQYMIDCGRHVGLEGCIGGSMVLIPNFIRNFGLYPTKLYPYQDKEGQCPYDEKSVKIEQTGYIRGDNLVNNYIISREFWGNALKRGPLLIGTTVQHGDDFHQYGGGILMGNCRGPTSHGVVLVGHGRKDGREYWIIRNSWGDDWGEGGYIRVDKECNCVKPGLGFVYGDTNPGFVNNEANDAEGVSRLIRDKGLSEDDANAASGQDF